MYYSQTPCDDCIVIWLYVIYCHSHQANCMTSGYKYKKEKTFLNDEAAAPKRAI